MTKTMIFIIICFLTLAGFATVVSVYAFNPGARQAMDYYLGPTGQSILTGLSNTYMGIVTNPTWLMYITPNLFPIGAVIGIIITTILLHPLYNRWTGYWAGRHEYHVSPTVEARGPSAIGGGTPLSASTRPNVAQPADQSATTISKPVVEEQKPAEGSTS